MASSRYLNLSSYFRPAPRSLKVGVEMNRGAYGTVHVGELNGQPVAVKKIHRLLLEAASGERESWEKVVRDFEQECRLLENLKHPHIVGFSGAFYKVESQEPILVMERMKENLRDLLGREDRLSLDRQLVICLSIARALEFLHSRSPPTVHRDLNDKNVMLDDEGVVKVGDLGQSRLKEQSVDYFSTGQPGAVPFMPPEALSEKPHYTEKIDMFSLGVLMLEVATGRYPSVKLVGIGTQPEIVRRSGDLSRLADDHPLKPFILECLKDDYKERPPSVLVRCFVESQVEKHELIKEIKEKDAQLQLKDAHIHQYRTQLTEKDTHLKQKDEDSGREYALLLQDYQQLQQEQDHLKREHDQLKASQQKPSPPASVQPLSIQPHQHKTPAKLPSASKQEVESQLNKAMNPTSQLERLELKESKSTKKLKIKELGTRKETLHFPLSHGDLWGIAVSPTGNIFVSDLSKHLIHIFNTQRQYIRTFSKEGTGKGQLKSPRGLAVDTNGLVYIANEGNRRVEVFKEDGSFVRQIGVGQLKRPFNVTIYGDILYIPDTVNHRVFTFNTSGELTQTIGGWGGGPGQFISPTAVAVYSNELFITDFNNRVQVFSVNGQYNRSLLRGQVRRPNDILITPDGEVLIADWGNKRVAIFNIGDLLHRLDVPYPSGLHGHQYQQ